MKPLYILVLFTYAGCLSSCGGKNTISPNVIVGKWNLETEHAVLSLDSARIIDTVYTASAKTYGSAQFNADGTFSSSSVLTPAGNSLTGVPSTASTNGTYSYSANIFTISPGLAGWLSFAVGSSSGPVNESYSVQITSLTNSNLDIHGTSTFGITNANGPHTFSEVIDYYYAR